MLDRIRVRWFRFVSGEDVFDGWPGERDEPAPTTARSAAPVRELQPGL